MNKGSQEVVILSVRPMLRNLNKKILGATLTLLENQTPGSLL